MRKYLFSSLAIAWTITITALSLVSLKGVVEFGFSFGDKLAHGLVYFIFTIFWFFAFSRGITNTFFQKNALLASTIFAIIYGICVEVMQETLVSNRQGDWKDAVANTIGTILAIVFIKYIVVNNRKLKTEN